MFNEEKVEKGVKFLDQNLGERWPERIRNEELNLRQGCNCVIGQLYGDFFALFTDVTDESVELGFAVSHDAGNAYEHLTETWDAKIHQLRAERGLFAS